MNLLNRFLAAVTPPPKKGATGTGGGGGGQLPPVAPPKVKNKQVSYPGFVTTIRPTGAILQRVDPNLANTDYVTSFRGGQTTQVVLRNLARANPDLAAALSAYLRVGIPEKYITIARNPDGSVNDDATRLAWEIHQRFDKLPAYDAGFSTVASVRSTSEALAKEGMLYGAMAMELVLDKGRLPYTMQPIFVPSILFYQDEEGAAQGLKPVQNVGGTYIDLDMPTFFMTWIDPSLNDPYPQGPFEAAIQPVLASAQFLTDMRRVMARHVYPRYDVTLIEENLRKAVPEDILNDPDKLPDWMNNTIAQIETTIQNLGPEEAIVHFDFIEVKYIENSDGQGDSQKFTTIKEILDASLAKGARVMPAVLGNGSGSQNVASTETMLFTMSANAMVRLKLQELYSRALTLAVRLFGQDVTVEFEFDEIELRPESELAAFRAQQLDSLTRKYALGIIGAMEFCLRAHGYPAPPDFNDEHGTVSVMDLLAIKPPDAQGNGYSGTGAGGGQSGGGASNQSRSPGTPAQSRGKSKQ